MDSTREEIIRNIARDIWVEAGKPEGRAEEHWALAQEKLVSALCFARSIHPAYRSKQQRQSTTISSETAAKLISHLDQFRHGDWDQAVLQRTKLCLTDSLACYHAGSTLRHFKHSATAALSSFIGSPPPTSLPPFVMAYLFGQAANALDFDDTLVGHPGAPIIGAVLALAIAKKLSMDQLLRGIAAGYEIHGLLYAAAAPSPGRAAVVRSVGAWDTVAASVGAAVALGLNDAEVEQAINIAAAHSILPYTAKWYERPVPAMKNNKGWIAGGAVHAINLLIAGQTGVTNVLDGEAGMWRMVGSDQWAFTDELLQRAPAILRVGFKPFPGCWHTQEFLKTLSTLLGEVGRDVDITRIVVSGPADLEKFCNPKLLGTADIAFSLPALFGQLIAGMEPGPAWEAGGAELHCKFEFMLSTERSLLIETRAGNEYKKTVEWAYTSDLAASGLNDAGVADKFDRWALPSVGPDVRSLLFDGDPSTTNAASNPLYEYMSQSLASLLD